MNDKADQQAERVGDDVALAPVDLLARVITTQAAAFRRLHTLAVDHAGRGAGLTAFGLARGHHQMMVDRRQQATGTWEMSAPQSRSTTSALKLRFTRSGAAKAQISRRVMHDRLCRLTPPIHRSDQIGGLVRPLNPS